MSFSLKQDHFLSTAPLSTAELEGLVDHALRAKAEPRLLGQPLAGKTVGMIFFNSSLRTRSSMAVAVHQLGGYPLILDISQGVWNLETEDGVIMLGDRAEHIKEAIPVLSRYVDILGVRCFSDLKEYARERSDPTIAKIAKYATVPVINLESAMHHPCQAVADMMTMKEKLGSIRGRKVVLTWAPHPRPLPVAVPHSFLLASCQLGANVHLVHPEGFDLDREFIAEWSQVAEKAGGKLDIGYNQDQALAGAEIVYAKSWGAPSYYGRWQEEKNLRQGKSHWQLTSAKMAKTNQAFFMHCLPVRRNVVVSDEVLDSPASVVIDEAENRLHGQKAILTAMLGGGHGLS